MERASEMVTKNAAKTAAFFGPNSSALVDLPVAEDDSALLLHLSVKYNDTYRIAQERTKAASKTPPKSTAARPEKRQRVMSLSNGEDEQVTELGKNITAHLERPIESASKVSSEKASDALVVHSNDSSNAEKNAVAAVLRTTEGPTSALTTALGLAADRPEWHAPWKMFRGISGHLGWVRAVAVDHSNEWFATGSADRTVKIWDLASGRLRLTLTGHVSTVRGIALSARHPYMFTVGEDKTVKCWDLEQNKVIRHYHGHLSGVYCVALHPTLDVLVTGGRDSTARVWDMRTRSQIFTLTGHRNTVNALLAQADDPQIVTASVDSTVRLWDLAAGKCASTLTNHKKGVRALVRHPGEFSFASASADNIKTWAFPRGDFMRNLGGQHEKLVNCLAVNEDGVLASGGDDGSLCFWDYRSAHCFQKEQTLVQPGSLNCEAGIYTMAYDHSGSRLITCEADKTIKMWKEDKHATPETHPLNWKPDLRPKRY